MHDYSKCLIPYLYKQSLQLKLDTYFKQIQHRILTKMFLVLMGLTYYKVLGNHLTPTQLYIKFQIVKTEYVLNCIISQKTSIVSSLLLLKQGSFNSNVILNFVFLGDCHGTISHRYRMARLLIYRCSNYKLVIRACVLPFLIREISCCKLERRFDGIVSPIAY